MFDIVIRQGRIIDGSGLPWFRGDVGICNQRIAAIGNLSGAEARLAIDARDRVVCPGFVDAHVHGDLMLLADPYHEPAIRQGVTTYILGQDGVAMAPASAPTLEYMRRYTAGFSGTPELPHRWASVADYLACFDRTTAVNVAVLVPNGNVRMEVMGLERRPPTPAELGRMGRLVRQAMEEGAVGLSSGLDYIPSRYAETNELIALCRAIAPDGGVYVTHMRRYDAEGMPASMEEVFRIGREAGVPVHISHFNSPAALALPRVDAGRAEGLDVTFDLYCYLAGSSILAMVALPPEVQEGGVEATLGRLRDLEIRQQLRRGPWQPRGPLEEVRLSFVAAAEHRHLEGMTLSEAAAELDLPIADAVCELLLASELAVGCIAPHRHRTEADIQAMMQHPAMMAGSDGIFTGSRPHPRGWGCFARYLGHYVRAGTWTLEQAVCHLSHHAARRFGLKDRGLLREGFAADVVVFDPTAIADRATFDDGRQLAVGVEHVLVNGELVLHEGKRTAALPGRPLRRG
ncbi:MAG: D-aminoacylase [Gemmataceae bacterium]|nr:D-aminoacylase [Gemmataceae bacterium]MDW8266499.1 D-aminoacylase [Gemmataceae bacterium]